MQAQHSTPQNLSPWWRRSVALADLALYAQWRIGRRFGG